MQSILPRSHFPGSKDRSTPLLAERAFIVSISIDYHPGKLDAPITPRAKACFRSSYSSSKLLLGVLPFADKSLRAAPISTNLRKSKRVLRTWCSMLFRKPINHLAEAKFQQLIIHIMRHAKPAPIRTFTKKPELRPGHFSKIRWNLLTVLYLSFLAHREAR